MGWVFDSQMLVILSLPQGQIPNARTIGGRTRAPLFFSVSCLSVIMETCVSIYHVLRSQ